MSSGVLLSVSSANKVDWVYRILDRRTIIVKAKNEEVKKIAAVDLLTSLPFGIEVPEGQQIDDLEVDKSYFATLKVYTTRNVEGIAPEYVDFFAVYDVDQPMEDFIKAYWLYPKNIRFELTEHEPT